VLYEGVERHFSGCVAHQGLAVHWDLWEPVLSEDEQEGLSEPQSGPKVYKEFSRIEPYTPDYRPSFLELTKGVAYSRCSPSWEARAFSGRRA
jgi:hypothetical protein